MIIVNVGKNGIYKEIYHGSDREGKQFQPGVNVDVSQELGEYLLNKYNNPNLAIHFVRGIDAIEHIAVQENSEKDIVNTQEVQPVKKKRGRKPKNQG